MQGSTKAMAEEWCTIESDPGVFTSLCAEVGCKGVQFEEVYSLGPEAFVSMDVEKIYGLVFLFKWKKEADDRPTVDSADNGLFFAQQVIPNACATQAILSVLMNVPENKLDLGSHLKEFRGFAASLNPEMTGLALSNSEVIKQAHNSFRHQSSFEIVKDDSAKGDDAFHFVGYIVHQNKVFELDGLQKGPILIGEVPEGTPWVEIARVEIERRIKTYSEKAAMSEGAADGSMELRFNLMAIVANKLDEAQKQIDRKRLARQRANISLVSRGEEIELQDEVDDDDAAEDIPTFEELEKREIADLYALVKQCTTEIDELSAVVTAENKRREQWAKENARRRFDLVPLALCAMRHLARKRQLLPAYEKGKEVHAKRVEEKKGTAVAAH